MHRALQPPVGRVRAGREVVQRLGIAVTLLTLSFLAVRSHADVSITDEAGGGAYHFVSTHRVTINAEQRVVWEQLRDLKSWMVDFELSHHSGPKGQVGEILRLYPDQDFLVQITKMTPEHTLVFANLPWTFGGEQSTGVAVISLSSHQGNTVVSLTMSRRYTWIGEGENAMRARRSSPEFIEQTNATWDRFLARLRALCEREQTLN